MLVQCLKVRFVVQEVVAYIVLFLEYLATQSQYNAEKVTSYSLIK